MTLAELKAEFRLTSDGDDWGNVMHWWFTIAEEIYWHRGPSLEVPPSWRFRPSPLGETSDPDDYALSAVREADDSTLAAFGALIHRYAQRLKHIGRDY